MNAEAFVFRCLFCDSPLERGQRRGNAERRIKAEGETSGKRRAKVPPGRLRLCAHHLEPAAGHTALPQKLGIKVVEIGSVANDHPSGFPDTLGGLYLRILDGDRGTVPFKMHAEMLTQESGQNCQHLAGVDHDLGFAEECSQQSFGLEGGTGSDGLVAVEPAALIAERAAQCGELTAYCFFVRAAGYVK